jgi:hypothetical protein
MISREALRRQLLKGNFKRVGELLQQWPIDHWVEIMGKGETNVRKKIAGTIRFILRDAGDLASYFDVPLDLIIELINAEEAYLKKSKTKL